MAIKKNSPEEQERAEASAFRRRVEEIKLDALISPYGSLISGLYESSKWFFVCSQHTDARLSSENELYTHFKRAKHRLL